MFASNLYLMCHLKMITNTKKNDVLSCWRRFSSPLWRHIALNSCILGKAPIPRFIPSVGFSDGTSRQQHFQVCWSRAETNDPQQRKNWKQIWNVPGMYYLWLCPYFSYHVCSQSEVSCLVLYTNPCQICFIHSCGCACTVNMGITAPPSIQQLSNMLIWIKKNVIKRLNSLCFCQGKMCNKYISVIEIVFLPTASHPIIIRQISN